LDQRSALRLCSDGDIEVVTSSWCVCALAGLNRPADDDSRWAHEDYHEPPAIITGYTRIVDGRLPIIAGHIRIIAEYMRIIDGRPAIIAGCMRITAGRPLGICWANEDYRQVSGIITGHMRIIDGLLLGVRRLSLGI
jgi:hypothetical protein